MLDNTMRRIFFKIRHQYACKEFVFLDSEVLLQKSYIFISIYRHTRAYCLRTSIRAKYFAKFAKVHADGFLRVWKKKRSFLRERRSHPVGYRRGRWATNNSMCAYKLIRLPTTLLPSAWRSLAPARPSIRPGSNSFEFVLRPPRRRRITRGTPSPESEMQANLPHDLTAPPTYASIFIYLLSRSLQTGTRRRREYRENWNSS